MALPRQLAKTLVKIDKVVGTGREADLGLTVDVHYTGWLYDPNAVDSQGKKFDSSVGREPFSFQVGGKQVIKGWDVGVQGMKVGGKRHPDHSGRDGVWSAQCRQWPDSTEFDFGV